MVEIYIYWKCDKVLRHHICDRLRLPYFLSINGETKVIVDDDVMAELHEYESTGYLKIRHK